MPFRADDVRGHTSCDHCFGGGRGGGVVFLAFLSFFATPHRGSTTWKLRI